MKTLKTMQRTMALGALIAISAAGLFGPALHGLAHLDLGSLLQTERAEQAPTCSCALHTRANLADQTEDNTSTNGQIGDDHDCALCRFLALSKQLETQPAIQLAVSAACEQVCFDHFFQPASTLRLNSAPRGPPLCV